MLPVRLFCLRPESFPRETNLLFFLNDSGILTEPFSHPRKETKLKLNLGLVLAIVVLFIITVLGTVVVTGAVFLFIFGSKIASPGPQVTTVVENVHLGEVRFIEKREYGEKDISIRKRATEVKIPLPILDRATASEERLILDARCIVGIDFGRFPPDEQKDGRKVRVIVADLELFQCYNLGPAEVLSTRGVTRVSADVTNQLLAEADFEIRQRAVGDVDFFNRTRGHARERIENEYYRAGYESVEVIFVPRNPRPAEIPITPAPSAPKPSASPAPAKK